MAAHDEQVQHGRCVQPPDWSHVDGDDVSEGEDMKIVFFFFGGGSYSTSEIVGKGGQKGRSAGVGARGCM